MSSKMGRPPKIKTFISVAEDVLFRDGLMLLTDEELVFLINEELEQKDKVSDRTFARWKAKKFNENDDIGKTFVMLIKKALIIQKETLFKKFSNDDRAWQRWAWIIERKFSEWNLKNINENKNDNTHTGEIKINYNLPNGD
tara:strand:+ start:28159 stop:28581 length:423 start_codon:yes stop_codon:yes gene_type:complete